MAVVVVVAIVVVYSRHKLVGHFLRFVAQNARSQKWTWVFLKFWSNSRNHFHQFISVDLFKSIQSIDRIEWLNAMLFWLVPIAFSVVTVMTCLLLDIFIWCIFCDCLMLKYFCWSPQRRRKKNQNAATSLARTIATVTTQIFIHSSELKQNAHSRRCERTTKIKESQSTKISHRKPKKTTHFFSLVHKEEWKKRRKVSKKKSDNNDLDEENVSSKPADRASPQAYVHQIYFKLFVLKGKKTNREYFLFIAFKIKIEYTTNKSDRHLSPLMWLLVAARSPFACPVRLDKCKINVKTESWNETNAERRERESDSELSIWIKQRKKTHSLRFYIWYALDVFS